MKHLDSPNIIWNLKNLLRRNLSRPQKKAVSESGGNWGGDRLDIHVYEDVAGDMAVFVVAFRKEPGEVEMQYNSGDEMFSEDGE